MQQKILLDCVKSKMLLTLTTFGLISISMCKNEAEKGHCFCNCVRVQEFSVSQGQQDKLADLLAFELRTVKVRNKAAQLGEPYYNGSLGFGASMSLV